MEDVVDRLSDGDEEKKTKLLNPKYKISPLNEFCYNRVIKSFKYLCFDPDMVRIRPFSGIRYSIVLISNTRRCFTCYRILIWRDTWRSYRTLVGCRDWIWIKYAISSSKHANRLVIIWSTYCSPTSLMKPDETWVVSLRKKRYERCMDWKFFDELQLC